MGKMRKYSRKETKRNVEAFKLYCDLKLKMKEDVFEEVAKVFNVKKKTIYNWSNYYNWKERYEEIEKKASEKALEKIAKGIEKQNIRTVEKALERMREVEDNIVGSIDGAYSMKDYTDMIKIYQLLTGGATERVENTGNMNYTLSKEERELISDLGESIEGHFKSNKIEGLKEDEK